MKGERYMKSVNLFLGAAAIALLGGWTQSTNADTNQQNTAIKTSQVAPQQKTVSDQKVDKVDKSALQLDVNGAQSYLKQTDYYSKASLDNLEKKMELGNAGLRSDTVSQQDVNNKSRGIIDAVRDLKPSPNTGKIDKSVLQTYVYGAQNYLKQTGYYSKASLDNLEKKVELGNADLRSDTVSQKQVNSAASGILNAVRQLEPQE